MTARLLLANIAAFALQVTVLVAAGAALARAFRIDEPKAMLAYWRTLLLACLVLPLGQPWNTVIPPALEAVTIVTPGSPAAPTAALATVTSRSVGWPIGDVVLIGLAAGIAARALWLAIGALALRRLRREAVPLDPLPDRVRYAQERIGARAGMYISDRISGPITFGLLRPVVVFPPGVEGLSAHVQEAMTYHELLHVQRRDWLSEILEEAVRTVLWFHPAIWWLIGRIQLTREQVVDQAAIRLTDSRERYVEALLAVAIGNAPARLSPVSPFFRRHLLKKRVARILQETTMTTRRLIASLTASAAALALAATFAVRSFPLEAQGKAPADNGAPVQIVNGGEHLLHGELPEYPRRAIEQKVEGDVVLDLSVDARGEISDARVLSGPEELRKAALESVLQWHYSPAALSSASTQTTLRFHLPATGANHGIAYNVISTNEFGGKVYALRQGWKSENVELTPAQRTERQIMELERAIEDPGTTDGQRIELKAKYAEAEAMMSKIRSERGDKQNLMLEVSPEGDALKFVELKQLRAAETFEGSTRLAQIRTERVSESTLKELLAQTGVSIGDPITKETAKRIQELATAMDEHFRVEFGRDEKGGIVLTLLTR